MPIRMKTSSKSGPISLIALMILFLVGPAAGVYFYLSNRPVEQTHFEISNFVGEPQVYQHETKQWVPAQRGTILGGKDKIKTGPDSEIDLRVGQKVTMRLKPKSVLEAREPEALEAALQHRLHLLKGTLLGATEKDFHKEGTLEITTPSVVAAVRGTIFQVTSKPAKKESWVGVLRGRVDVSDKSNKAESVSVGNVQKVISKDGKLTMTPLRITRDEWSKMKEAYQLIQKSLDFEAKQIDLSKESGSLFEYVFDHGTFYMPEVGYAGREFIKSDYDGSVYAELEYDVFPPGSFVGMYIKTRNFDLYPFEGFEFEARRAPEEDFPNRFRIEMKYRGEMHKAFTVELFKDKWQKFEFPIDFKAATPVDEIALVFTHDGVGEFKKGFVQLRNFNMIKPEKPKPLPPTRGEEDQAPVRKVMKTQKILPTPRVPAKPRKTSSGPQAISLKSIPENNNF